MTEPKGTLYLKPPQIVIHWPDGRLEAIRLGAVTRLGRGEAGNDVAFPDSFNSISRRHVEIRREHNRYRLLDIGSRNGVLVNQTYVTETLLNEGDEIHLGQADLGQQVRIEFQLGNQSMLTDLAAVAHETLPQEAGLASDPPADVPYLKIRWPSGKTNYFPLVKERNLIGRAAEADLRVPENLRFVSNRQAEVLKTEAGYSVRDLNSTNGTLLNNHLIEPGKLTALGNEAILRVGDDDYGVSVSFTFLNPAVQVHTMAGLLQSAPPTQIDKSLSISIGRLPESDVVLDDPRVSRTHAVIHRRDGLYLLEDLDSSNGTFVNDAPIRQVELHNGDMIQIGKFLLQFHDGNLIPYESTGMRLDAAGLSKDVKTRAGPRRILDNINLSVLPREFVALVGGSGAGKSTLLNALIGIRRGEGQVRLNAHDFYREYDSFRAQLGYVPQSDILHTSLTVEKALEYSARLRLPSNLSASERRSRIDAVLDTVSMNTEAIRRTRLSNLSGGQRKRVSIAAELLADPKLIYLDEATSGLDPGLEKKMMYTLRRMADEGRTVVLVTHATNNIVQTDHVAFLSEGKLVYFGPSEEALEFFQVEDFADIYERIDRKGEEWRQIFEQEKPAHFQKYVRERQKTLAATPKLALKKMRLGIADFFRQLAVLTQRSLSVLFSDPITLFLMLLLFPVTATLQLVIATPDVLTGDLGILADPAAAARTMMESYTPFPHTNTFVFVMGLEAVLTGLFVPSNDLVKERSVFLRERMVNLRVLPYLLSKALIYSVFVVIQVALYLLIISFGVDMPERGLYFNGYIEIFITLYLTMMAGISFGLIISAVSKTTEMAIYILTMLLFFQFFFAGAVFDLRGNRFEPLSYLSTTRWSLTALGVTIDMNSIAESTILCNEIPENPIDPNSALTTVCFNYPDARDDLRLNYEDEQLARSWAVLGGMTLLFLAVTWFLLRRQESA